MGYFICHARVMAKLPLIAATGPRAVPLFASIASVAAHGAIAVAAVGYGAGRTGADSGPRDLQVEVEAPVVTPADPEEEHRDDEQDHARVEPHSHPYPVAPNHDAVPHSPSIDHRVSAPAGALAAAPSVLTTPDSSRPTFSIVLGQAAEATGGASWADGTGDGSAGAGNGPAARAPGGQGDGVFPEAAVSRSARLVSSLRPEYPATARTQGVEATVSLEIVVDREGNVVDARVVRGAGYGFEESALRALRQARFSPAIRDGQPVRVRMAWTVEFRLD